MATLNEIVSYTDALLNVGAFKDYCPNGLQVEGSSQVHTLVSGVSASARLLDAALALKADAILVHHGYFWKGEDARIIGYKKQRLQRLLRADVNLLAYHLPLDAHPELGNNARLAQVLDINISGTFDTDSGAKLGMLGSLLQPRSGTQFAAQIERALGRTPLHVAGVAAQIKTIAWCSGGAQGYIDRAAALGVDAYLTGEVSEYTVHIARETGLHFFAAGHHATERYGVQALGAHLAQHFGLRHEYVEIENPA